jgi:uncharacterized cupin superfamily protein
MKKSILNLSDVSLARYTHGETIDAQDGPIGSRLGAKKLGSNLTVVAPGKRACPFHCHHVNEELFYIIEGQGILRYGDQEFPIRAGDIICAVAGGPATAHQIVNTSDRELKYLGVSTMIEAEVMEYPDTEKFVVYAGAAPGGNARSRTFSFIGRNAPSLDYWDGEK